MDWLCSNANYHSVLILPSFFSNYCEISLTAPVLGSKLGWAGKCLWSHTMAAVSPVMVISLEISGPRRPGEPSSPARIAASQYSHNSNTNPASIGDPEPFYLLGPTFLSNKCQLGTKKVSYFFQFLPQTNFQYSGSNQALHFCSCKHICFYPKEPRHLW